jgi:hypothetical protein
MACSGTALSPRHLPESESVLRLRALGQEGRPVLFKPQPIRSRIQHLFLSSASVDRHGVTVNDGLGSCLISKHVGPCTSCSLVGSYEISYIAPFPLKRIRLPNGVILILTGTPPSESGSCDGMSTAVMWPSGSFQNSELRRNPGWGLQTLQSGQI